MRRHKITPIQRSRLIQAVINTYDDSKFFTLVCCDPDLDFLTGTCPYKSAFMSKQALLAEISKSSFERFPEMHGHKNKILISNRLAILRDDINHSQILPKTKNAERYQHVYAKGNPHYEIYFNINHIEKEITFALADRVKKMPLVEHTEWCWKPTRSGLLCKDSKQLEASFLDDLFNPVAVTIGRRVLGIKAVV